MFERCSSFCETGELSKEEDVLEWLIENKSTGDDEEVIEDVTAKTLSTLIGNVDNLVVLFCKWCVIDNFWFIIVAAEHDQIHSFEF